MSLWSRITSTFAPGSAKTPKKKAAVPGVSERVSVDRGGSLSDAMGGMLSGMMWISALFPFAIYKVMDELFKTDPYFAKFKQDTLSLGNCGHEIEIDAATEQQAQKVLQIVNDFAARCYPIAGGADGLFNGMLSQICRGGGLCAEFPPFEDLSGVKRAYLVRLRTCRWRIGPDKELQLGQLQDGVFVPLNPVQTSFVAAETFDENPYPIPPALAALSSVITNQKFEEGIRAWTKKVGSFGLLQATAERPEMLTSGETDAEYYERTKGLLADFTKSVAANMTEGVAAAWDNVDFKFTNTNAGAAGAKDMAEMILHGLFAGLVRDPVFFGHAWGTTDTFASVVYRQMAAQIRNFQRCAKRAYEHGLRLELAFKAMGDVGVSVKFDLTDTLDEFMASEAEAMLREKYANEYTVGIASKEEARQKLGYEDSSATSGAFIASFEKKGGLYVMKRPNPTWTGFDGNPPVSPFNKGGGIIVIPAEAGIQVLGPGSESGATVPPFSKGGQGGIYGPAQLSRMMNSAQDARKAARQYLFKMQNQLSDAAYAGVQAVYEWARTRDIPEEDLFVQQAMETFLSEAEGSLDAATLERIAKDHLSTVWTWARHEDDSVFGIDWDRGSRGTGIGFGMKDETALNYMSKVDRLYVSKYVSGDEATSRQVQDFLREQYIEKGLGRGKENLAAFRDQFGDLTNQISDHRARVIIDTGVSRCQNWGELMALDDEGFTTFRIAGPWDSKACDWCKAIRNKEFIVRNEVKRINKIIDSGDEDISKFSDFVTSRFSGKEGLKQLQGMDAADVQKSGMVSAPIHPLCRHRTIAVVSAGSSNSRIIIFPLVQYLDEGEWLIAA